MVTCIYIYIYIYMWLFCGKMVTCIYMWLYFSFINVLIKRLHFIPLILRHYPSTKWSYNSTNLQYINPKLHFVLEKKFLALQVVKNIHTFGCSMEDTGLFMQWAMTTLQHDGCGHDATWCSERLPWLWLWTSMSAQSPAMSTPDGGDRHRAKAVSLLLGAAVCSHLLLIVTATKCREHPGGGCLSGLPPLGPWSRGLLL